MSKYCPDCGRTVVFYVERGFGQNFDMAHCLNCTWRNSASSALSEPLLRTPAPKMKYVSIDIETTGLDPDTCQVLEFGAVLEDWQRPVAQLPTFRRVIHHKQIVGTPFALALNAGLLRQMETASLVRCAPESLGREFHVWLLQHDVDPNRVQAAGKNFASFDLQFLKKVPFFNESVKFNHRIIDPGNLFWRPFEDEGLPGSAICMERAGIDGKVAHTAVEDAIAVVKMIRYAVSQ
jgi:hypothetical protein